MDPKLYRAVASGNESSFGNLMLMMGCNYILQQKTTEGNTTLHVAALNKQAKIAEKIIELGSSASLLCHQNSDKDTPLHIAARVGCSEIVKLLIDSADSGGTRSDIEAEQKVITRVLNVREDTVLHEAVHYGHLDVVEILIHKDPGLPLIVNSVGASPLFLAIDRNLFEIAKFLLEGNECSFGGRDGMNALHAAVARLGAGRLYNIRPEDKFTDIMEVMEEMKRKLPSSILEEDDQGWTPLHYAAKYGCVEAAELFLSYDNSVVAYKKDKNGLSAFHVAAQNGHVGVMDMVIRYCPDIWELLSNRGQTALHVAVIGRNISAIEYLSSCISSWGVVLNRQDKDGNTPLHLAALLEDMIIIGTMLRVKNVDRKVVNNEGLTALDIILLSETYYQKAEAIKWFKREEDHHVPMSLKGLLSKRNIEMEDIEQSPMKKGDAKQTKRTLLEDDHADQKKDESKTPNHDEETLLVPRGTFWRFKTLDGGELLIRKVNPWSPNVLKKSYNNQNAVIAALIATVTFTAAFQIPGGYESDGPNKGLPILRHKVLFKLFMLLDSIALGLSCLSILNYFWIPDTQGNSKSAQRSIIANFMALISMVGAFILAVLLISEKSSWFLKLVPFVCGACFFGDCLVHVCVFVVYKCLLILQSYKTSSFIASTRKSIS